MVLNFIGTLLRASPSEQGIFSQQQIPQGVFTEHSAQIHWVYKYQEQHGRYPSVKAFQARFPDVPLPKTRKETVATALKTVLDVSTYRRMLQAVESTKKFLDSGADMPEVLSKFQSDLSEIQSYSSGAVDLIVGKTELADTRYRERVVLRRSGSALFNSTPWAPLNDLLGFAEYGEHNILAARTNIGKSWIALLMAIHLANRGEKVLFVSKEMQSAQLLNRIEAILFKLPYSHLREGKLKPSELRRWRVEREKYGQSKLAGNLILTGDETVSGTGIRHVVSKIEEHHPTAVVVDGAYLIYPDGQKFNNDVQRFTVISNTFKRLSKAYRLLFWSVIQGNRQGETQSGDTRLSLKDIYGADAWAQDADNVLLLGGRRGASSRLLNLAKGRESNVGEFTIKFQLNPYPDFQVLSGQVQSSKPIVEFKVAV